MRRYLIWMILLVVISSLMCRSKAPLIMLTSVPTLEETQVDIITLVGDTEESRAEISGMAWCEDELILLPQYPDLYRDESSSFVFSIPKFEIDAYLAGNSAAGIRPKMLAFDQGELDQLLTGFEGFESIAFYGHEFFVTIETHIGNSMLGYLVKGEVLGNCEKLVVHPETRVAIEPQADLSNMTDETLLVYKEHVYSIYEANGVNVNPHPVTHVFDLELDFIEDLPLPNVEYRITDATVVDENGEFYAMNYFFPGDTKLKPEIDQIALDYGLGESHVGAEGVERILLLKITKEGLILVDQQPIYLVLDEEESRNWEGIVRYEDGFLLVTDKFPTTILAYVENTNQG